MSETGAKKYTHGNVVAVLFGPSSVREIPPGLCEEAQHRIQSLFPGIPVFSYTPFDHWKNADGPVPSSMERILLEHGSSEQDTLLYFPSVSPFIMEDLIRQSAADHFRYLAQYTYGENIPPGLMGEWISLELMRSLEDKKSNPLLSKDLKEYVIKNMGEYDVEIFYRSPDMRQHRLDFTCSTERSIRFVEEALKISPHLKYEEIPDFIKNNPRLTRSIPSYLELELTDRFVGECSLWPPSDRDEIHNLSDDHFEKILSDIKNFGMVDDLTVDLGGAGEPMEHPRFFEILDAFLQEENVKEVFLETFGYLLDSEAISKLAVLKERHKLHVILRWTTRNRDRYRKIYGSDLFDTVQENINGLESFLNSHRAETSEENKEIFQVYAEILRIVDVEDEIEDYFRRFEKSPIRVIVQKYNSYVHRLEERRVSDLTPIHRDFCWHLARDLYITAEGNIPVCKQDLHAESAASKNISVSSPFTIFESRVDFYGSSLNGRHHEIPMSCPDCDEWYTFNG